MRYLKRYWQRGMNKNAILPDYLNSGAKTKSKTVKKGQGFVITPQIQKIFQEIAENYPDETSKTIYEISAQIAASKKLEEIKGLYNVCVEECYIS